jgi:Holliday junction resolvasome RuvABC endonuclease subunit
MIALGAHVKILAGRYSVGFAWIDDDKLLDTLQFPAPADREEPHQLGELHGRVFDLIGDVKPEIFVLKPSEIRIMNTNALTAHRAEGVVLSAASRRADLTIESWGRQSLATQAGLGRTAKGNEVVDNLVGRLSPEPKQAECRQAAAAALGALLSRGTI